MKKIIFGILVSFLTINYSFAQSTLNKIKETGTILVGYREWAPPFSYIDNKLKPTGFGWEICGAVIDEVKKVTNRNIIIETRAVAPQYKLLMIQNGTIDIECATTNYTPERATQVGFANNYFYTGTRFLVKSNSSVLSINNLKGKKVASTIGSTNYQLLRNLNSTDNIGFELIGVKDHIDGVLLVESDKVDAFGMDDVLLYALKSTTRNPSELKIVGDPLAIEPYAIIFRKDDPEFKNLVNWVLAKLVRTGEFNRIYKKWFESPIPPNGINLNLPMSKELKENLKTITSIN